MGRAKGTGSVFQRKDGYWVAVTELPPKDGKRQRKFITAKTEEQVIEKMRAFTGPLPERPAPKPRRELMIEARKLGTHTEREWQAVVRVTKTCRYCKTELNTFNAVKDHIVSVARGGSDAIDNLQRICWECNNEKADRDEYAYQGSEPRPFAVFHLRRNWYDQLEQARASRG